MSNPDNLADMTVEAVLTRWPHTADIFGRHNMACIGCPVAPFYTIAEAAVVYKLSVAEFVSELEQAIAVEPTQD